MENEPKTLITALIQVLLASNCSQVICCLLLSTNTIWHKICFMFSVGVLLWNTQHSLTMQESYIQFKLQILDKRQDLFHGNIHSYLLFYYLHLLLDRHPSDAEGRAQLRSSLLLQQFAVVFYDAMCLSRQLTLGWKEG